MPTETSNPKEKTHRSSCEEMMEEMFPQDWDGCDCEEVMAQFMSQGEIPEECPGMMSRMMEMFVGQEADTNKTSAFETTNSV